MESQIRRSMRNQPGTEPFIVSGRQNAYNKLMGIEETIGVFRQPSLFEKPKSIEGEGEIDLASFNEESDNV